MVVSAALRTDAILAAKHLGFGAAQVTFSDHLKWIDRGDGELELCTMQFNPATHRVVLYLDALRSRRDDEAVLRLLPDMLQQCREYDESKHPRDDHGRWTDAGGETEAEPATPDRIDHLMQPRVEHLSTIAKQAARDQGYDSDKITVMAKAPIHRIGGKQWTAAASAEENGRITVYAMAIPDEKRVPGYIAHEIEHQKYFKLMNDWVVARKQFPDGALAKRFDAVFVAPMNRLHDTAKTVSPYATSWWEAAEAGEPLPSADIARNETLAEIARIERETGALPPGLSPEWKAAYDFVNEHWAEGRAGGGAGNQQAAIAVEPILHDGSLPSQSIIVPLMARVFDTPTQVHETDVEVLVNPSVHDLIQFINQTQYGQVRALRDVNANLFVWDAGMAIHDDMAGSLYRLSSESLQIDETTYDNWQLIDGKLTSAATHAVAAGQDNARRFGKQAA